jgi:phospho-N-acetylmuramoyl-pentapeptide-transferase
MFYHIFYPLSSEYSFLNVFRYITFRSAWAGITALVLCLLIAPRMIQFLQKLEIGEKIRDDGPERHLTNAGTPTMGGLLILFSFVLSTLLWANLSNIYIWVIVFVAVGFGLIGLYDDVLKFAEQVYSPDSTEYCRCRVPGLFRSGKKHLRKSVVCPLLQGFHS